MTQPFAAGALGASLGDMLRWDAVLRNNELLPAATLQQMQTPASMEDGTPIEYGFGWAVGDYAGHRVIQHAGGIPGFATFQIRYPDDDLSILLLCNWEAIDVQSLGAKVSRVVLGLPTITRRPFLLGAEALRKFVGTWSDQQGSIELRVADGGEITLVYPDREQRLLATSRALLYVVDDTEITLDFADQQDGSFTQLTINYPFFRRQLARADNRSIMS
jgi:CubicO group peptidase (beta-lactamase class C family)